MDIRYCSIIYDVTDDLKALGGMMAPRIRENFISCAESEEVFDISKVGKVAGCVLRKAWSSAAKFACCATTWLCTKDLGQLKRFTHVKVKDTNGHASETTTCPSAMSSVTEIESGPRAVALPPFDHSVSRNRT